MSEKASILVVDDEQNICDLLEKILVREGYHVAVAYDGKTAIELALEGDYALHLLDIRMPSPDGIEVLKRIREAKPSAVVVMMTGYAEFTTAQEALRHGAYDYITKPIDHIPELSFTIQKAIQRHDLLEENRRLVAELQASVSRLQEENEELGKALQTSSEERELFAEELTGTRRTAQTLRENLRRSQSLMDLLRRQLQASAIAREISKVMSSSLNYQQVIRTILAGVHEALDFDRVIFFTVDRDKGVLCPSMWVGEEEGGLEGVEIPMDSKAPLIKSLMDNQPILSKGTEDYSAADRRILDVLGADAFVAVPLYCPRYGDGEMPGDQANPDQFHGAIWIDNAATGRPITADLMETLASFANQAAIAIDNANTYTELEEKERALEERSRELAREKEYIERVVNNMREGLVSVDASCCITYCARSMEDLTGFKPEELIGKHLSLLDPAVPVNVRLTEPSEAEGWAPDKWLTGELGEEGEIFRKGGEEKVFVLKSRSLLRDHEGKVTAGVLLYHDQTKRRELEDLKADFTSMIVHDLRTPITAIRGFLELLTGEEFDVDDAERAEFYELMDDSSEKMLTLVNDFLDLSKIEAGRLEVHPEEGDLISSINSSMAQAEVLANKKKIKLVRDFPQDVGPVIFDSFRMEQVLINLLSNAIKFTPEGGQIAVGVISGEQTLEVSVTDTGIGIAADELPLMFQKYSQASGARKIKGTGLGLVICKDIVEAHGGSIRVESESGKGTTFRFNIPRAAIGSVSTVES